MALARQILIDKTDEINFNGDPLMLTQSTNYDRGAWFIAMAKNWGGGKVTIETNPDNNNESENWIPLVNPNTGEQYEFEANGSAYMPRAQNLKIRGIFRDGTGNQEVSLYMM